MTIVFSEKHEMVFTNRGKIIIFQINIKKNSEWLKSGIFTLNVEDFRIFLEHYYDEARGLDG